MGHLARRSADAAEGVRDALAEFAELNRRRLFGSPPLAVRELERWLELRARLETVFTPDSGRVWDREERRQFMRLPTQVRLGYGDAESLRVANAADISQGGLFLATRRPLEPGSSVRLALDVGGADPVHVDGVVSWVRERPRREGPRGMGIAFARLDRQQRKAIARLVQQAACPPEAEAVSDS